MFCFTFLASMPGLCRKKCKACQHVNSKACKRCGGAEGAGTTATASECYGVSVVHVTCSVYLRQAQLLAAYQSRHQR